MARPRECVPPSGRWFREATPSVADPAGCWSPITDLDRTLLSAVAPVLDRVIVSSDRSSQSGFVADQNVSYFCRLGHPASGPIGLQVLEENSRAAPFLERIHLCIEAVGQEPGEEGEQWHTSCAWG